jgi:hypothetical protein
MRPWHRGGIAASALTLLVLLAGCVTSRVEQIRQSPGQVTALAVGEQVVVLSRQQHGNRQTEESFTACLERELGRHQLAVMPEQTLVDQLYPWLEPRLAPLAAGALPKLLDIPGVEARIRAAKLRYMIWVDGQSESTDGGGSISCAAAPGFAGCFGFGMWDKESNYKAEIWDLEGRRALGKVSARATGTSFMPAVVVPIPIIARTENAACKGVADQLADLIRPG